MRERFQAVLRATAGAQPPTDGYWVGDTAEERRAMDDFAAGRIEWHQAKKNAQRGLQLLDTDGDQEMIAIYLEQAEGLARQALMRHIPANAIATLATPAQPRGRRLNADRDARIAAAVFAAEARGLTRKEAQREAADENPDLRSIMVGLSARRLQAILAAHREPEK
jgi:hypothetical protein